ncbi:MAG: CHAT domain-containing protein [Lewinellaceae bacterium]|nr:CHAT domain-containing protein [Lewinellaceae bacterium]
MSTYKDTEKPAIFLAFANEYEENRRLDNVVKERELLESILNEAYRNGLCDKPIVRQNVSIKMFLDILGSDEWKDRIAIIHYGGHADGYQLLLEGMDGKRQVAKGDGLVNILARRENQENLKLVFLNGCSTERLAKALTDHGVPIVIGTSTSIKDDEALTVATRFYTGLANGLTMAGAWADAKSEVESVKDAGETVKGPDKSRGFQLEDEATGNFPWEEAFRDRAAEVDFKNWNLPEESKNPLFNLPPLEKTQLPASPFLFLKPYEARHAEIFFGRSSYIRDLWLKVVEPNAPPIILLYGESGAGKSSLLDAGLRPRLEAAKKEGRERFEVRYLRRDPDKGLVGTLADMLSYAPEPETKEPAPTVEAEADPNLDKILRIEAIASGLEEETANTFRSIIDQYKAIRAYKPANPAGQGLYHQEADGSFKLDKKAGAKLRQAWIKMEKETGRELIVILDQVEEAITQPNSSIHKELESLLGVLKDIFVRPATDKRGKIKGKIILGYREEFNAKILARSQDYELSPSTVFLEQLKEGDIKEIFRELPKLRNINYYNLTVEEGLANRISSDLLKGRSAVAPVLQLLLTRLWENTYDPNTNSAHFTIEAYNKAQSGGREMEKYFRDQMEEVRKWNPEVVESGLVLDILQFHVTELGTSRRRDFEKEIRPRYQHLEEEYGYPRGFVEELAKKLKSPDIFLLNDEGRGYTSLPHDTLAPIVRREYDRSDKLGQRSARILEIKKPDLIRVKDEQEEEELRKLRLNDNDLEVVRGGKTGMRSLNERERALLRISLEEREKRVRQRRAWAKAGIVGGLFILALSILAGSLSVSVNEQLKEQVIAKALDASLIEQDKDQDRPSIKAIQLGQFAYNKSNTRRVDVVDNLYSLYKKDHLESPAGEEAETLPLSFSLKPGAKVDALDYNTTLGPFLVQYQDSMVKYWPADGREETINLGEKPDESLKEEVHFSADGKKIQAVSYYYREPLYIADGELVEAPWMAVYSSQSENGEYYIGYYDLFAGKLVDEFGRSYNQDEFMEEFFDLGLNDNGEYIVNVDAADVDTLVSLIPISVDTLFSFKLMNEKSKLLNRKRYEEGKEKDWWYAVKGQLGYLGTTKETPLRKTRLALAQYADIQVWNPGQPNEEPESITIERELLFFQALSDNRFLAVTTAFPYRELLILDNTGTPVDTLLPSGAGLLDLAISPDRRHIFAMTKDAAFIWSLSGKPIAAYPHDNIRDFSFSEDGFHLLTYSSDTVKVLDWTPGQKTASISSYSPPQDTTLPEPTRIVMARFHDNAAYLVIGLEERVAPPRLGGFFNWFKNLLSPNKKGKDQPLKARIVYRDFQRGQERIFEGPNGPLLDATVSRDGQYAVALQPGKATVIPLQKAMLSNDSLRAQTIEAVLSENYLAQESSKVLISPGGKYIVRQSPRSIELFDPSGKRVNSYSFQDGFQPGFNGQLFTLDDYFLIGEKSDEVLFWHPEDQAIKAWAKNYELFIGDQRDYELTTFMDDIPGAREDAKWWGLRVLLASLIFILLYYSDFIIQAIQHKKYLEPAFYFFGFSLFSLLLLMLWIGGAYEPEMRKVVFYSIVWATLALLLIGIYSFRGKLPEGLKSGSFWERLAHWFTVLPKLGTLIAFMVVGIFVLYGSVIFFLKEAVVPNQVEWPNVLAGLFIPLAFMGLIGYPIQLVIRKYRAGAFSEFYRWLLLPVGFPILIFWIAYGAIIDNGYGDSIAGLLGLASGLVLLWAIVRQSRIYLRARMYAAFCTFAFPVAGILFLLLISGIDTQSPALAGLFTLALPAAFILGRQHRRQGAYRKAFLLFSTCIFLGAGALTWAVFSMNEAVWLGLFLLAPALVLVFYGLRRQLKNRAARNAAGKWAWPNWIAILGFWALAQFLTSVFTGAMLDSAYAFDEEYEEYPYPEEEGSFEDTQEAGLTGEASFEPAEPSLSNQEEGEGLEEAVDVEPAAPAEADFDSPLLNNRQQLISKLFDPDEITRERARAELETYWKDDRALIPELIQYSYENPGKKEGVREALELLAVQSDQLLRNNRNVLEPYLEWVGQTELGIDAEELTQSLSDRIGN